MQRKLATRVVLWGIVLGLAATGYISYRNNRMDRLYAEAAGYPKYFRGDHESTDAVRKLAAYRGHRATALLVDVALGRVPLELGGPQLEAIKELEKRNDLEVAPVLATILQPHEGLNNRRAAAEALQHMPCNKECVGSILHYLERVWRGEPNYEDRFVYPPSFQDVPAKLRENQQMVYDSLYRVLQREKVATLTDLQEVYGLGSNSPSPFALGLVSRLGLPEACILLEQSDQVIQRSSPRWYNAPRQELQAAIDELKCK